jgi:hypothetical protein
MKENTKEFGPETPNYAVLNEALRKHKKLAKGVEVKPTDTKGPSQSGEPKPSK